MSLPEKIESLTADLPDAPGARRFFQELAEKYPAEEKRLLSSEGLLSDVLTLAAFSPLLATTMLQHPNYISWLSRQRKSVKVRGKEEILESLARFALVNSNIEPNVLLARFRRRELLRIYLRDIRRLGTIVEITEEISNLADAILEHALRQATQQLENRYGVPLETDEKMRSKQARFCIVALGKLGSNELNYASDIDLLFLYSGDGATTEQGERHSVTNREYFNKLAEYVIKLVGGQSGEGAAYRVDMRLRPHGRVGALAISAREAAIYYKESAQSWERQVLIRSRACAGDAKIFQRFFDRVKSSVFSTDETVENALRNVRLSKEKINLEKTSGKAFNVKLGTGGIREIEFIAQALQLAYGGEDEWLRAPHSLISLSRLADRRLLTETELTELFEAYDFLRRIEHRLQMENGLQTHLVPNESAGRFLLARRLNCRDSKEFDNALSLHTKNVNKIFSRVFNSALTPQPEAAEDSLTNNNEPERRFGHAANQERSGKDESPELLGRISPHFAEMFAAGRDSIEDLPAAGKNYQQLLLSAVQETNNFARELAVLRKTWSRFLLEIVLADVYEKITLQESKNLQTKLAEASIETALFITRRELERRLAIKIEDFPFAVLGLGKLGGGGMDYGSDLDLILIYDEEKTEKARTGQNDFASSEILHPSSVFYARAVEIFVTALSSLTRDGLLYRVDLRLRPDGKNGANSLSNSAFLNYLENRSAIWEWLAYVKLRGAAGDLSLAVSTENRARKIIHENALKADVRELKDETRRVRKRLEEEKSAIRTGKEIDIKFGAGGMLDVYFAMRFLQLRDNVPDDAAHRSTLVMLDKLYEKSSLEKDDFQNFSDGYAFLSELDHNLRLVVGRSTRLPMSNQTALQTICSRMRIASVKDLLEQLTLHRLNIRASFEKIAN